MTGGLNMEGNEGQVGRPHLSKLKLREESLPAMSSEKCYRILDRHKLC